MGETEIVKAEIDKNEGKGEKEVYKKLKKRNTQE